MTEQQIIEWAREAGGHHTFAESGTVGEYFWFEPTNLTAFANLVAQHQKEQDALTCKRISKKPSTLWEEIGCWKHAAENCEAEIRSQE